MDLLHSSTSTPTGIVCTAVSNECLLELATETDLVDVGRVDGDGVPRRLTAAADGLWRASPTTSWPFTLPPPR